MPSPEQSHKIKSQFEILSVQYYVVKTDFARGARRGQSQWQYDQWKAKDAKRQAEKLSQNDLAEMGK